MGERGEVKCETILDLRNKTRSVDPAGKAAVVVVERSAGEEDPEPPQKKSKGLTLEEYESVLDQDTTFDDIDLDLVTEHKLCLP